MKWSGNEVDFWQNLEKKTQHRSWSPLHNELRGPKMQMSITSQKRLKTSANFNWDGPYHSKQRMKWWTDYGTNNWVFINYIQKFKSRIIEKSSVSTDGEAIPISRCVKNRGFFVAQNLTFLHECNAKLNQTFKIQTQSLVTNAFVLNNFH